MNAYLKAEDLMRSCGNNYRLKRHLKTEPQGTPEFASQEAKEESTNET